MVREAKSFTHELFSWESFWLGGFSLFVWAGYWLFVDRQASLVTLSEFAFGAAFVANHPHFVSSYALLYRDFGAQIFRRPRYVWAAIVAPILLCATLAYAVVKDSEVIFGHCISLMYFLVGWHYAKQFFGCIVVSSVRRGIFFSKIERRTLLGNLLALWLVQWMRTQVGEQSFIFYGIRYGNLNAPVIFNQIAIAMLVVSGLAVVTLQVRKYVRDGIRPAVPAMVAWLTLYVWNLPVFLHPGFAYFIPLFHSLQYLALVMLFKRNQVGASLAGRSGRDWRDGWVRGVLGYFAGVTILGAAFFQFIPGALDDRWSLVSAQLGTQPWLATFLIFINVHHYFIDNVIWRSDNADVKQYLFTPEKPALTAEPVEHRPAA